MADQLSGFSSLLYKLSRIPGLGFLYSASATARSASYSVDRAKREVDDVKRVTKDLKGNDDKDSSPTS